MSGPRIYVASLADYNAGNLHGVWIEDLSDVDAIQGEINTMLRASKHPNVQVDCLECDGIATQPGASVCGPCNGSGKVPSAEEWAVHDHEGFEGIKLGEHPSLDDIVLHASMLDTHDGAWAAYVGNVGAHSATEDGFSESYRGEYSSPEDYAKELISECYDTKDMGDLANYIDYEKFARDLRFDGYSFVPGGSGVYVFTNS